MATHFWKPTSSTVEKGCISTAIILMSNLKSIKFILEILAINDLSLLI